MRISRTRAGTFSIKLPDAERELLVGLSAQLRELLVADNDAPALHRLYPTAYLDDKDRDAEYQQLVHGELLEKRLAAIDVLESTVHAKQLDEGQLQAWMGAINDVRLVLGTILDVSEDMDDIDSGDPRAGAFAVYGYLTHLLSQIVHALASW
jgi:hypothetical protein